MPSSVCATQVLLLVRRTLRIPEQLLRIGRWGNSEILCVWWGHPPRKIKVPVKAGDQADQLAPQGQNRVLTNVAFSSPATFQPAVLQQGLFWEMADWVQFWLFSPLSPEENPTP